MIQSVAIIFIHRCFRDIVISTTASHFVQVAKNVEKVSRELFYFLISYFKLKSYAYLLLLCPRAHDKFEFYSHLFGYHTISNGCMPILQRSFIPKSIHRISFEININLQNNDTITSIFKHCTILKNLKENRFIHRSPLW